MRLVRRSFVLLPEDRRDRTFREYHCAHRHAAAAQGEDAPRFDIPDAGQSYPRCSFPALEAAAWVRDTHPERFSVFDLQLFEAFFGRIEDIGDPEVLCRRAGQCDLEVAACEEVLREGTYRDRVLAEYQEALDLGIRAIPAVVLPGRFPIVGAVLYADLRRAVDAVLGNAGAE